MGYEKEAAKETAVAAPKLRDLQSKKNPKGGGGGIHVGPNGRGG